jgi:hypothetical protein
MQKYMHLMYLFKQNTDSMNDYELVRDMTKTEHGFNSSNRLTAIHHSSPVVNLSRHGLEIVIAG